MLKDLGLNTESFYKFITTLSLVGLIYCLSYEDVFLTPHNKIMAESNLQIAEWDASRTYFYNLSNDLVESLPDSIKKNYTIELKVSRKDTIYYGKYFNSSKLTNRNKIIADSINVVNRELDILSFKIHSLFYSLKLSSRNIKAKFWVSVFLGISFGVSLILSMIAWYKNRKEVDK